MTTRLITIIDGPLTPGDEVRGRTNGHWRSERWSGTYVGVETNDDGTRCHRFRNATVNGSAVADLWIPVHQVADR